MISTRIFKASAAAILILLLVVPSVGLSAGSGAGGAAWAVAPVVGGNSGQIQEIMVSGKPPDIRVLTVEVPSTDIAAGINVLSDVPAFDWSYGCSATAAAMLFGYYDRTGYGNMYSGATDGGVCPLDNSVWGDTVYASIACHECPLSATHQGVDGCTLTSHVDDYWIDYEDPGPDPYITNAWTEHVQGDCTGDFMGTNQSRFDNVDGATAFYFLRLGGPLYDFTGYEPDRRDGCHGLRLFAESRGYTVLANFNQYIKGAAVNPTKGFTFANYMAEIDAGRPVLIQVEGHTMLGYGYNSDGQKLYIRDTWDHSSHEMTWGGTYAGMRHYAVTVLRLATPAYAVSWNWHNTPSGMDAGQTCNASISLTNDGNFTWPSDGANPVHLAYHWYTSDGYLVEWDGQRTVLLADVAPGGSTTLSASVTAPGEAGGYILKWDLVQEGVTWFGMAGASTLDVAVGIAAEYGVVWAGHDTPSAMDAGQTYNVSISLTNDGNFTWPSGGVNPVHLAYHWYTSEGYLVEWDGQRTLLPADVAPGGSTTLSASVTAPGSPGSYILGWDLVQEGVTWFGAAGASTLDVAIAIAAEYGVVWDGHDTPSAMDAGQTYNVSISLTNDGNFTWPSGGVNPVHLAYHWYTSEGYLVEWDGQRTLLPADVAPGGSTTVNASVTAPGSPGNYILKWDLVQEGATWFGAAGCQTLEITLDVAA